MRQKVMDDEVKERIERANAEAGDWYTFCPCSGRRVQGSMAELNKKEICAEDCNAIS